MVERDLSKRINSIRQLKTGSDVIADRYRGRQAVRWQPDKVVAWHQPPKTVADSVPRRLAIDPAVARKIREIKSDARKAAVLSTLAAVSRQTNYSSPYPTPLTASAEGIGVINMVENVDNYDVAPALWDPQIWFSSEQIAASHITPDGWNPIYWDQATPMLDPREVESDLRKMYGDEGLAVMKEVMQGVAAERQSQNNLNQMHHPMRVPVVMMDIWRDASQTKSFAEFMTQLQKTMRKSYDDEAYILGRREHTPADPILDAAEGVLGFLAKAGLIGNNKQLQQSLEEIRQEAKKAWSV